MEHCQHNDTPRFRAEEQRVWKAACPNTANIPMHYEKAFWVFRRQVNGVVDLQYELNTQTRTSLLVP
jgi:hypothetical protein